MITENHAIKMSFYSEVQLFGELLLERDRSPQKEMAKKYGISEQYMSDILNNKRPVPKKVAEKMGFMPMKVYFRFGNKEGEK